MTITTSVFNMGLLGAEDDGINSILLQTSLLCYSGRHGGLETFVQYTNVQTMQIGGDQDHINMLDGDGRFKNFPVKELFFGRDLSNLATTGLKYEVRIEYDIVTLTTAEQADLYQRGLC